MIQDTLSELADCIPHLAPRGACSRDRVVRVRRLLLLDETLFRNCYGPLEPGSSGCRLYQQAIDLWREIACGYAVRRRDWEGGRHALWCYVFTARILCASLDRLDDSAVQALHDALTQFQDDLPEWFLSLCRIKDAWVWWLRSYGPGTDLARLDALCAQLRALMAPIRERWVRDRLEAIIDRICAQVWSDAGELCSCARERSSHLCPGLATMSVAPALARA